MGITYINLLDNILYKINQKAKLKIACAQFLLHAYMAGSTLRWNVIDNIHMCANSFMNDPLSESAAS